MHAINFYILCKNSHLPYLNFVDCLRSVQPKRDLPITELSALGKFGFFIFYGIDQFKGNKRQTLSNLCSKGRLYKNNYKLILIFYVTNDKDRFYKV
jgi:hypothetical protein